MPPEGSGDICGEGGLLTKTPFSVPQQQLPKASWKRREGKAHCFWRAHTPACLISRFISRFLYAFPAFHNTGVLPVSTLVPERRVSALLPLPACSSLSDFQLTKRGSLEEKGCLRVTSEGKSSHKAGLSSSATSTIRLARNILSSKNGFVLCNLSVPNHPSPTHTSHRVQLWSLGAEKKKKENPSNRFYR